MPDDSTPGGGNDSAKEPDETPVTLELLADLQAGLLDDATAARLRRRIRDDPELARRLASLDQVRRDLTDLAATPASDAPPEVTDRISAALRNVRPEPPAPGATDRPRHASSAPVHRHRTAAVIAAAAAALILVVITIMVLDRSEQPPAPDTGPTAETLRPARHHGMPLSDQKILGLLNRPPALGPLADSARLASCLQGLGYSTGTRVLGATTLDAGQVLLVLPETDAHSVMALLVTSSCRASDAGLLADAPLTRP